MSVTANDLRDTLKAAMDKVMNGELDVASANAMANLAGKIIDTAKTEVHAAKIYSDFADINTKRSGFLLEDK